MKKDDPQPAKLMILSGAASSAKLMEVKVAYHSVPRSLKSLPKATGPAVGEGGCSIKPKSDQVLVDYASPDAGISGKRPDSSPVCGGIALNDGDLNQQTWSPATVVCTASGLVSKMPSQIIDSDPSQSSCAVYSASAGYAPEEDGAPSGSMKDEPAIGVTNTVHSVLDVGAPFVAEHSAGSPHRPLISTGVDGVAISDELGPIPGVDGSTPESIARIARKYSLVDVVDGLLNKAPFDFQEVRSIPLSGCPVKGSEAPVDEAVRICDPGHGLELTLPSVDPYAGDPLSDDYGILHSPDHHLPCCSKASGAPVGPSSEIEGAVQGLSPWAQFGPINEELDYVANDIDHSMLDVRYADASSFNALIQQSCNSASDDCLARGLASSMSAHQIDFGPILTTSAKCSSGSVGDVYENDEAHSGPMSNRFANVDTNSELPELDEDSQNVADHADGSYGVANSVVIGPIPGVDDSTPESIARITRKYSLAEVVDVSLIKAPSEVLVDSSCPLPGCPVEGYVDSMAGAVMPCILEHGLVHTMPISSPKPELVTRGPLAEVDRPPVRTLASVRCMSPGVDFSPPADHAKSSVTMDAGCSVGPAMSSTNPVAGDVAAMELSCGFCGMCLFLKLLKSPSIMLSPYCHLESFLLLMKEAATLLRRLLAAHADLMLGPSVAFLGCWFSSATN
ncbi:hypothetical protein Nepgr_028343 [Nepenthes gracilis]|uniref:Uncharacterized protein n=1 Tax=Nepenthes gracilis TaxID=150966 RepID=A0AAD3TBI7_NEPGR|nr:hypothetical protein Nepgr_028343 [Nepenthes gracilis]